MDNFVDLGGTGGKEDDGRDTEVLVSPKAVFFSLDSIRDEEEDEDDEEDDEDDEEDEEDNDEETILVVAFCFFSSPFLPPPTPPEVDEDLGGAGGVEGEEKDDELEDAVEENKVIHDSSLSDFSFFASSRLLISIFSKFFRKTLTGILSGLTTFGFRAKGSSGWLLPCKTSISAVNLDFGTSIMLLSPFPPRCSLCFCTSRWMLASRLGILTGLEEETREEEEDRSCSIMSFLWMSIKENSLKISETNFLISF